MVPASYDTGFVSSAPSVCGLYKRRGGAGERGAATRERGQRDQAVKSEKVRRHESIREYKDVDRPLVLITQEQQNKNKNKNSKRRRRKRKGKRSCWRWKKRRRKTRR